MTPRTKKISELPAEESTQETAGFPKMSSTICGVGLELAVLFESFCGAANVLPASLDRLKNTSKLLAVDEYAAQTRFILPLEFKAICGPDPLETAVDVKEAP